MLKYVEVGSLSRLKGKIWNKNSILLITYNLYFDTGTILFTDKKELERVGKNFFKIQSTCNYLSCMPPKFGICLLKFIFKLVKKSEKTSNNLKLRVLIKLTELCLFYLR